MNVQIAHEHWRFEGAEGQPAANEPGHKITKHKDTNGPAGCAEHLNFVLAGICTLPR